MVHRNDAFIGEQPQDVWLVLQHSLVWSVGQWALTCMVSGSVSAHLYGQWVSERSLVWSVGQWALTCMVSESVSAHLYGQWVSERSLVWSVDQWALTCMVSEWPCMVSERPYKWALQNIKHSWHVCFMFCNAHLYGRSLVHVLYGLHSAAHWPYKWGCRTGNTSHTSSGCIRCASQQRSITCMFTFNASHVS